MFDKCVKNMCVKGSINSKSMFKLNIIIKII
jgi:hypothetical protein